MAAVLALGAALAACGQDEPAAKAPPTPAFENCSTMTEDGAELVYFTDPTGTRLAGALYGDGKTGITLAHMSDGDACAWEPHARLLADAGYRVVIFYFQANGDSDGAAADGDLSDNVVGAAKLLRDRGSDKVVLMGGSMGGAASVAAAPKLVPPPAAVISVSAPTVYPGAAALGAAPKVTVPVLYLVGEGDGTFPAQSRELYDATPAGHGRKLVIVPSSAHGINLLGQPADVGAQVKKAVDEMLAAHAPAAG
jgi:pimeloyl-ACP methyl ester carboxylesterase